MNEDDINIEHLNKWWNNRTPEIKKMIYFKWFNTKNTKALVFVEHLENHLKQLNLKHVICKICNKTIDEIFENYVEDNKINI